MPLDPGIANFLKTLSGAPLPGSLAEMRAAIEVELPGLEGEVALNDDIKNYVVNADDGHGIALRVYTPVGLKTETARPAMLFAHGGGWCLGSLSLYDRPCQTLANATDRIILSVDYRLAPEHPFPRPLDDVYQALCWVYEQAAYLGIDTHRLAVAGDSAGGNLAAATALLARDRGGPEIEHQLLFYPALSRDMATESYREFAEGYYLTRDAMAFCWENYLGERRNDYAEPLHADSLRGLPPATILSCEYDPLRDEAEQYAQRLQEAGVTVRCVRLQGMIHACLHMSGLTPAIQQLFELARG